jgi:hypothetical protein
MPGMKGGIAGDGGWAPLGMRAPIPGDESAKCFVFGDERAGGTPARSGDPVIG